MPSSSAIQACRDPDDDKFPETALVAQADCIVTGDGDLLALDPFEHIRIVTAAGFLEAVSG
ncbi:MAG: putative toxin-antitoxin system toxin component, PIN family [Geminicoccaceae bacterium]